VIARNLEFHHEATLTWEEVAKAWKAGDLRFAVKGKAARQGSEALVNTQYTCVDFEALAPRYREKAKVRYRLIQPLLNLPVGSRTKKQVIDRLQEALKMFPPEEAELLPRSYQGVYELISVFERSGRDIRSLIPRVGKRNRKLDETSQELMRTIDAVIQERWLTGERQTVKQITDLALSQVAHDNKFRNPPIPIPTPHALYMRIARRIAQMDPEYVVRRRLGDRHADQMYGSVGRGPQVSRVLQQVQIDHTVLDLFIVDDLDRLPIGRPRLTFCLDVLSGMPLGMDVGFEPASVLAVRRCLRNAILPKDDLRQKYPAVVNSWTAYGVPETLVVDNGLEFIGRSMADACLQLGIELIQSPIRTPQFKGAVERWFGKLNKQLLHGLPGTSFSNVIERGEYDSTKNAVITLSAFMEMLHIFVVDYFAQRPNSKGIIPAKEWDKGRQDYPPALPWNKDDLNVLLGAYEERVLGRQGIEFSCLFYNSPALTTLRTRLHRGRVKEPIKFKYDPADLSRIWVYDQFDEQWIETPCTDQAYTQNLSLWKHRVIKRFAREELGKVDYVSLADAKAKIQAIVDREWAETKRITTRKKLARWKTGGFDSTRFETRPDEATPEPVPTRNTRATQDNETSLTETPGPKAGSKRSNHVKDIGDKPTSFSQTLMADDDLDLSNWRLASPASLRR